MYATSFLVTGGTSHKGVGMQPSWLSLSQHVFTSLTAFSQADCGDFVMSRPPASNSYTHTHTHSHTHRHTDNSSSLPSLSFPLLSGSAKMR